MKLVEQFKLLSSAPSVIESSLSTSLVALSGVRDTTDIGGQRANLWPLFITRAETAKYEIDTCATALGYACTNKIQRSRNQDTAELDLASLFTLISLRREDGSWPSSQVRPGAGEPDVTEGVVNDTVFALTALLAGNFFSEDVNQVVKGLPHRFDALKLLSGRISWLSASIEWIERNRIDSGWFYTSTEYMGSAKNSQFRPAVGPTASLIILLNELARLKDIKIILPDLAGNILSLSSAAVDWIITVQGDDGGFGRDNADISQVSHTAICIQALAGDSNSKRVAESIRRATAWLVKASTVRNLNNQPNCFDIYEQIIVKKGQHFSKRQIAHENPVEPYVLRALSAVLLKKQEITLSVRLTYQIRQRIFLLTLLLLDRQEKVGNHRGKFKSRRQFDNERYTVYWQYHAVSALLEVSALLKDKKITFWNLVARPRTMQIAFIVLATEFYLFYVKANWTELIGVVAIGIATNVLSTRLSRE